VTRPRLQRGSRGLRLVGWALGAVLGLALLGIGAVIWFFGVAWPHSGDRARRSADDQTREVAATIARQLQERSVDGQLTRAEITDVVGHQPAGLVSVALDGNPLAVVAKVHGLASGPIGPVSATQCYQFTIATPVGPASQVDTVPLAACPVEPGPSS
jgi:hypothetical protein